MTNNECYVYISTMGQGSDGKRMWLPCYPDSIGDNSESPSWQSVSIIGRSPIVAYTGYSARSISFTMTLHRDMRTAGTGTAQTASSIENILKNLRAAVRPNYTQSGLRPPLVIFRFGTLTIRGYVTSLSHSWKKPIIDKQYSLCDVSVSVTEIINPEMSDAAYITSSSNPSDVTSDSEAEWLN